jgi:hypothetical protein
VVVFVSDIWEIRGERTRLKKLEDESRYLGMIARA